MPNPASQILALETQQAVDQHKPLPPEIWTVLATSIFLHGAGGGGRPMPEGEPPSEPENTPPRNPAAFTGENKKGTNPPEAVDDEPPNPQNEEPQRPSFAIGASDGGPGTWQESPYYPKKPEDAAFQQKATGAPPPIEYIVQTTEMRGG